MAATAAELLGSSAVLLRRGPYALGAWPLVQRAVLLETLAALPPDHGFVNFDEREVTVLTRRPLLSIDGVHATRCHRPRAS